MPPEPRESDPPMLTIFALPKPFRGHIATIQRNAIGSWVRLHPSCQVLLFGDEEGTAEVAKEFGLRHIPEVARNDRGTPLLSDMFQKAHRLASHEILCYVNCDIVFGHTFPGAIARVNQQRKPFLMVGECWNLEVLELLAFDRPCWNQDLQRAALERGKSRGPFAIDYFVFPRGLYGQIPGFAAGRAFFDNWLIWKARALGAAVVDATPEVLAIHQHHNYAHVAGGWQYVLRGEEANRNLALAGGLRHRYLICDATHRLTPSGLKPNLGRYFRLRSLWEEAMARIESVRWGALFWRLAALTRPIRHPLGLRLATFERLASYLSRQK